MRKLFLTHYYNVCVCVKRIILFVNILISVTDDDGTIDV